MKGNIMSDKYEFEQAQRDDANAKLGMAGLALGLLGLGVKGLKAYKENEKQKSIAEKQAQIDAKKDQYRTLAAKWFKSSVEKHQMERLQKEISELESQKNELET